MKRRLEIARALQHRPRILFLDEPTSGLDPQTRNRIWEFIRGLCRDERVTVFFTTHYMEEAERVADAANPAELVVGAHVPLPFPVSIGRLRPVTKIDKVIATGIVPDGGADLHRFHAMPRSISADPTGAQRAATFCDNARKK